jgi:hypothetical protein
MNAPFQFTPQATEDLDAIWWFIAGTIGMLLTVWKWKSSQSVGGWRNIP